MRALLVIAAIGAVGCSPTTGNPDAGGVPPQCVGADAGSGTVCAGAPEQRCALELLRVAHADCTLDSECALLAPFADNCLGYAVCDPAPAVREKVIADFVAAARERLAAHCATTSCRESSSCVPTEFHPACVAGRCTSVLGPAPDAGTDAGP